MNKNLIALIIALILLAVCVVLALIGDNGMIFSAALIK